MTWLGLDGDLEPLPASAFAAAPGAGPAVLAAELPGRVRAELPCSASWGQREQGRLHLDALMAKLAAAYQP